jgi:hypothetical protein
VVDGLAEAVAGDQAGVASGGGVFRGGGDADASRGIARSQHGEERLLTLVPPHRLVWGSPWLVSTAAESWFWHALRDGPR